VLEVEDKWIRLQKLSIVEGKLAAHFVRAK